MTDSDAVTACAAALEEKFGVDRLTALRFARARKGDQKKAANFLAEDLAWRKDFKPEALQQADCQRALANGHWRLLGTTPAGLPVLFVVLGYWNPGQYSVDEYRNFVCYFLEAVCRVGERFVVLFDFRNWKLSHALHMRKIVALISTLQDHYPERLEAAVLLRVPSIFSTTWKAIRPFIDPVTAAKVTFVTSGADAERDAVSHVGAWELLPSPYGGPNQAVVPVPNIPGEPEVASAPMLVG